MLSVATRRKVRKMLAAGHSKATIVKVTGVSLSSLKRIAKEADPENTDFAELRKRRIGRPSIVEPSREFVQAMLAREPGVTSATIYERVQLAGYKGGKTALYALIAAARAGKQEAAASGSQRVSVAQTAMRYSGDRDAPEYLK